MRDFASLKCTNWLVKCNLCASDAVLALERRLNGALRAPELARTNAYVRELARPKSRPQNESGLKLPCAVPAAFAYERVNLAAA